MEHGDPALWWTLDPQRKALVVGYLAAAGMDRQEAERKHKRHKGKAPNSFMGIRGLEVESR